MDGYRDEQVGGWMDRWVGRRADGWMDKINGWIHAWVDGWMNRWMEVAGRIVKQIRQVSLPSVTSPKGKQFTFLVGYMP